MSQFIWVERLLRCPLSGFFVLAALIPPLRVVLACFNLLILDNVRKHNSSHVCIVSSLMVMGKELLAIVVFKIFGKIELHFQVMSEFFITCNLLIECSQACLIECLRVEGKDFVIVGQRETVVPLLGELDVGLGKLAYELVVHVDPVIHAVVSNQGFFSINHGLDHQRETHLMSQTSIRDR